MRRVNRRCGSVYVFVVASGVGTPFVFLEGKGLVRKRYFKGEKMKGSSLYV